MNKLSHADLAFIEHRRSRRGISALGLPLALVALVLGWGGLYVWWPTMMNPLTAYEEFAPTSTELCPIARQAAVKVIFANVALGLVAGLLVMGIAFGFVERRYRKLIATLAEGTDSPPATPQLPRV